MKFSKAFSFTLTTESRLSAETKIVEAVGALDQRLRILEAAVEKEVSITTR
jgi:hypothetical protein